MHICITHINLERDEVIFEICVKENTVYVIYCNAAVISPRDITRAFLTLSEGMKKAYTNSSMRYRNGKTEDNYMFRATLMDP